MTASELGVSREFTTDQRPQGRFATWIAAGRMTTFPDTQTFIEARYKGVNHLLPHTHTYHALLDHHLPRHCPIAAILGFGGIAGTAIGLAKIVFFIFVVLFVASLIMGRRPKA